MGAVRVPVHPVFPPGRIRDDDLPAVPACAGRPRPTGEPSGGHPGGGGGGHRLFQRRRGRLEPLDERSGSGANGVLVPRRGHDPVGGGAVVLAAAGRSGPARDRVRHLLPAGPSRSSPPLSRCCGQGHSRLRAGLLIRPCRRRTDRQCGRGQLALGLLRRRASGGGRHCVDSALARARPRPIPTGAAGPAAPVRPNARAAPVVACQCRRRVHALCGDRLRARLLRGPGRAPRASGHADRGRAGAVCRREACGRCPLRPLRRAMDGPAHDAGHLSSGVAHAAGPGRGGRGSAGPVCWHSRLGLAGGQRHAGGRAAASVRMGHRHFPGRSAGLRRPPVRCGQLAVALLGA